MPLSTSSRTFQEVLLRASDQTSTGARFIRRTGEPSFYSYRELIERAKAFAAALQAKGIEPGDRVALVIPTSVEFFDAFLGCQLAGAIPAALYPPFRLGKLDDYYTRSRRMLAKIGAKLLISSGRSSKILGPVTEGVESLRWAVDAGDLKGDANAWRAVEPDPSSPAFLQFSSGSTRDPKAVIVSHAVLLSNLEMMADAFRSHLGEDAQASGVCWLPLYHDMGLVGCMLNGLHYPASVSYIAPEDFIVQPSLWFRTISQYNGTVSPAPHFAYRMCVSKVKDAELEGVDLSGWLLALNGAEPVEAEGMRLFAERFSRWGFKPEAMTPVYGLAEAGLAVSFSNPKTEPLVTEFERESLSLHGKAVAGSGRQLPSVGTPLRGIEVQIWDQNDQPLTAGSVGKIVLRGPSITPGFYNDPDLTQATIRNGWLDSGDLGFFHEGELYIAGRAKDLIIIRGKNYAPQEIEELLLSVEGVRTGCAVALSTEVANEGEQLVVLAEYDQRSTIAEEQLKETISQRIVSGIQLKPYVVAILEPGTLPRTSSGKFRRADALKMFLAGELTPPEKVNAWNLLLNVGKSQLAWGRFYLRNNQS